MADQSLEDKVLPTRPRSFRWETLCLQVTLALFFLVGIIVFPIGYNEAYIKYPLPAYPSWRANEGVVEATKYESGACSAKLWFAIIHTSDGFLEQPKRIVAWADWPGLTKTECSALFKKREPIYYDTADSTRILTANSFLDRQASYENSHAHGNRLFWIGVSFILCVLIPAILFLAALVGRGLMQSWRSDPEESK
jgi:hypothetical protein